MLERGGKVFLVMLHEVGVFFYPVSEVIEERRLKTAETIVESGDVRLAELIRLGVALTRKTVDDRSTGIAQSHHLRAFVYCLACRVVYRLSQHLHVVIGVHLHYLRVSSAYQKADERQGRL